MAAVLTASTAPASNDVVVRLADRLVATQNAFGHWGEFGQTGEVVAGLVRAYELTGDVSYRDAAERAGQFILGDAGYDPGTATFAISPFAGETYGLSRLADIAADPAAWSTPVAGFFAQVSDERGAQDFVDSIIADNVAPFAVYDIARYALAAHAVDGTDKDAFRSGIMAALAAVEQSSDAIPTVFGLGVGVWGLASTGPLDGTLLPPGGPDLGGLALSDLPGVLAFHQDFDGLDGAAGDFYGRFTHVGGTGHTETTAMGTLGLEAARRSDPLAYPFADRVAAGRGVLADGVSPEGAVYFLIGDSGTSSAHNLAGETLEALPEPGTGAALAVLGALLAGRPRREDSLRGVARGPTTRYA